MRARGAAPLKGIPEEILARNVRPETETQQARGEDVGDLREALVGGHLVCGLAGRHTGPPRVAVLVPSIGLPMPSTAERSGMAELSFG